MKKYCGKKKPIGKRNSSSASKRRFALVPGAILGANINGEA